MSNNDLDEVDRLAAKIEETIAEAESINEEFADVFDPQYRRRQETTVNLFG